MNAISRWPGRWLTTSLLLAMSLLLGGCVTGYGGYPGGHGQPDRGNAGVTGTVQGVDRSYNRIVLQVQGRGGYGRDQQLAIQYDQRTRLHYQGRTYPVEGLERGDVIRADVQRYGNRLLARSVELLRNVRDRGRYGNDYGQANTLRGSIVHVDPRVRVVTLDAGYGRGRTQVRYDDRTVVEYRGRRYRPENLERGDVVSIRVRRHGNRWLAEAIRVERDSTRY